MINALAVLAFFFVGPFGLAAFHRAFGEQVEWTLWSSER